MASFVGLLVVSSFLLLVGLFFVFGFSQSIFNPPYLAFVLQLFFVFGIGLSVAFVSAKSYIQTGAPNILLLGNAILISSLSFTVSATLLEPKIPPTLPANQAVIIGNVGVLISSLVLLFSAIVTWLGTEYNPRVPKKTMVIFSFLISIATVAVISVFSSLDLFPVFLTSSGPTLLRLFVLALTTIFYFASSVLFGWQFVRGKSQVVYWFSLALALFGTAYLAGVLTIHLGSAMTWVSRLTLYLSGAFLLFALLGPKGKTQKLPYAAKWSEAFRSDQKQMETFISKIAEGFAYCKIITDGEGKPVDWLYLDVNDSFERINDTDRSKVVGRKATEVLPGIREDPADWINVYGQVALTGEPIVLERFSKDRNKWYRVSAYSPRKGYFVSLLEDITVRKKAEEALHKLTDELEERVQQRTEQVSTERQRLYNVLEALPAYVILLDKDHRVPFANKVFRELFGESHGKRCHEYLFNRDSECENCITYKVYKENKSQNWYWTGPDNRDYDVYDFPFREADGSTLILEMGLDITDRKKAESAVQAERKRLFGVLETVPIMVCLLSTDYHVAFANRSFRDKFGESNGRHCYDYCFGKKEPCEFCESYKVLETGQPHHWEVNGADGSVIDAYDFPFADVDGSRLILEMDIDITARKKAEAEALESAKKLKDAERLAAIGATAGMVGHDIRNPLQAITSDVYLAKTELASAPYSEEKKNALESLEEIAKNTEYINKIVQDLQDYARPLNPQGEVSDLQSIIEKMLTKNPPPENIKVSLKVENAARRIKADSYFINRILYNLVTNSVQAMPNGGQLTITALEEANDTVITVTDTGVGIPQNIKEKLFTPMFTTKSKGQGFGLPVVKRMTEALGGTVKFESEEGKGTKFTIRLPPPKS